MKSNKSRTDKKSAISVMSKYTSSENMEGSSARSWSCNAALISTCKLDSDASKSTRVVQDFGVTVGEIEEPDSVGQSSVIFSENSRFSVQWTLPERHWQSS